MVVGVLAFPASPSQLRCKFICQGCVMGGIVCGSNVEGGIWTTTHLVLGVSIVFIIWGVMGTHCFPLSLSTSMSSASQYQAMVAI